MADITETTLRLPKETPLVGFHARVDVFGLVSLGLILVDTLDEQCQLANYQYAYLKEAFKYQDKSEQAMGMEGGITREEKERA